MDQVTLGQSSVQVFRVSSFGIMPPNFRTSLSEYYWCQKDKRARNAHLKKNQHSFGYCGALGTIVPSATVNSFFSGAYVTQIIFKSWVSLPPRAKQIHIQSLISNLNCFRRTYQQSTPGMCILTTEFHVSLHPPPPPSGAETVVKGCDRLCNNM
jgi:hypothetical protein